MFGPITPFPSTGTGELNGVSIGAYSEKVIDLGSVSGAVALDASAGTVFIATSVGDTTWSVANVPATGATSLTLVLTNGGGYVQTWPANVAWVGGSAPELSNPGTDEVLIRTYDGGQTLRASKA